MLKLRRLMDGERERIDRTKEETRMKRETKLNVRD